MRILKNNENNISAIIYGLLFEILHMHYFLIYSSQEYYETDGNISILPVGKCILRLSHLAKV